MKKTPLLYLVHRIPYPPNKGDKVRSFHLLKYLASRYDVFLATFVDYEQDMQFISNVEQYCAQVYAERIYPGMQRIKSLQGLFSGEALTLPYYRSRKMAAWIQDIVATQGIERAVVFSSSMAQYLDALPKVSAVTDFVDVDSAKWVRYADDHHGALSWLYRREGRKLLEFECQAARKSTASVFVSDAEAALFRELSKSTATNIHAISNGVNAEFFSPEQNLTSPYGATAFPVVFTGAMDYWPNIDAVQWFAQEVWPTIRTTIPHAEFYIVGMNPAESVRKLTSLPGVHVTGTVADVRPYIRFAQAVVAPMRVARGVQNKILEAMAMARPVIASDICAAGLSAQPGSELFVAATAEQFATYVQQLHTNQQQAAEVGALARQRVLTDYSWEAHLKKFDALIQPV